MIITLWLIATITFFLMQLLPGTPYTNQERLSPETIEMLNKQVGLDKPVIVQYGIYLSNYRSTCAIKNKVRPRMNKKNHLKKVIFYLL